MRGWILALIITLAAATYQRMTGPSYPAKGAVTLGATTLSYRLTRTHGGKGGQPVILNATDPSITGQVEWKRYPTSDPFTITPMRREGDRLIAEIPHQPAAGKVQYRVLINNGVESTRIPSGSPVITRFKGHVPLAVLIPHIILMFCAMLYSNRAAIEVFQKRRNLPHYALGTSVMLLAGGMVLGPIVQKAAFGQWWTGIPFGYDLTDNKTLIALVAWLIAAVLVRRPKADRIAVFGAAVVTLVIFAIPHSVMGSQYKYDTPSTEVTEPAP
jgi:hypothetical protein